MQLKTVTSVKDLPFGGIEFIKTDKAITEIVIGGKVRVRQDGTYSSNLKVLVEAPYEEARRYRLTATIDGFDPKISYFDSKYEADSAGAKFEDKGATISVEEVTVYLDDSGNVVPDAVAPQSTQSANDQSIPF